MRSIVRGFAVLMMLAILAGQPVLAQQPAKQNVKKELVQIVQELPADVQQEVLEYARRKQEAVKRAAAALETPAPAVAGTPAPAVPAAAPAQPQAPQQAQAAPQPKPAQPAPVQPQAIQLTPQSGGVAAPPSVAEAAPAAPAAPAQPEYLSEAMNLPQTVIEWASIDYDYGKVEAGKTVTYVYKVKNTGSNPLKLTRVKASCGCTTPEWSKDPIPPGGEGFVKASFNTTGRSGYQAKTITVTGNFPTNNAVLKLHGEVLAAPAPAGAPR
ncbi:MAG: DUF1573 domain-containing protein [Bacteroidia bacterium]|nr:DUF1573 domain-containing protein [Bacteroidia bacterium]